MATVDVQRAFRSMTVPPPMHHEPGERTAAAIEEDEPIGLAVDVASELPELESTSCDDECEALAREAVVGLRPVLSIRPQKLELILELLEIQFDVSHGEAERLFWLAHERGFLSLNDGRVSLGPALSTH